MTNYSERPQFEIGRVIERTFGVLGHNLVPFLTISLVFAGLPQLVLAVVQFSMLHGEPGAFSATGGVLSFVGGIIAMICSLIMQGAIMQGTISDLNGEKVSVAAMFETGFRFILPLLGIGILYGLALVLGFIFLVVPGFIVGVMFCVAAPSAVIERTGVFGAFARSRELTRNHRWMIFFLILIAWVVFWVIAMVLGALIGGFGLIGSDTMLGATAVVTVVIAVVQGLITSSGIASIYYELRTVKDGIAPQALLNVFD